MRDEGLTGFHGSKRMKKVIVDNGFRFNPGCPTDWRGRWWGEEEEFFGFRGCEVLKFANGVL